MEEHKELHCLHVYTGNGKGKTTMAVGAAVRMRGHDGKVLFAQFLKNGRSGELLSMESLGIILEPMPCVNRFYFQMNEQEKAECRKIYRESAEKLKEHIRELRPSLLVLDELCVALSLGILNEEEGKSLIREGLRYAETVATGREAPDWLRETADYLTVLESPKHPFQKGLKAREGIEW